MTKNHMKNHTLLPFVAVALSALTLTTQIHAQSPLVTIDTITVGDPGNVADFTGFGAVDSTYSISKYETTISQYTTFLNSVASVTTNNYLVDLWYSKMSSDVRVQGINRSGSGTDADPYNYSVIGNGNRPIANVSWIDAARFANWMHNGATNGASTETGAYTLNGALTGDFRVNPGAIWSLPSEDQWYKAAYYKGGNTSAGYWLYPTQSNEVPGNVVGGAPNQANFCYAGVFSVTQSTAYPESSAIAEVGAYSNSSSAYGTYDQGGSLNEWTDGVILGGGRIIRGGDWNNSYLGMESPTRGDGGNAAVTYQDDDLGFRLVTSTVPEPSTYALMGLGTIAILMVLRRKNAA
jgi:sulfatase modifying factor 1